MIPKKNILCWTFNLKDVFNKDSLLAPFLYSELSRLYWNNLWFINYELTICRGWFLWYRNCLQQFGRSYLLLFHQIPGSLVTDLLWYCQILLHNIWNSKCSESKWESRRVPVISSVEEATSNSSIFQVNGCWNEFFWRSKGLVMKDF